MKKNSKQQTDIKNQNDINKEIANWKRRYELIAEASGQIVYDYCLYDGSIMWGGSIEKVLGYNLSEMRGGINQWKKLIHKEDRKEALRLLETAEKNSATYEIEYRCKHKDGHYVDFLDRGFFVPFPEKNCIRMIGMMLNVSSQKRSDKLISALNTAVLEMQKVFSREEIFKVVAKELKKMSIDSMVLLVDDTEENLIFEYFSYDSKLVRIAEKIAGIRAEKLPLKINSSKEYGEVVKNKKSLLVNSNVDFIRQILPQKIKFMAEQLTKMFKISRFILTPLIVDDNVFGIFSVQAEGLLNSDIPTVTIFAHQLAGAWNKGELIERIQNDIILQKKAEQKLNESNRKINTLIDNLPGVVYRCKIDSEWTMEYISNGISNLSGYPPEDFIDNKVRSFGSIIIFEDIPSVSNVIEKEIREKKSFSIEYRIKCADGTIKWVMEKGIGIIENNRILALEGYMTDITESKKTERENVLLAQSVKSVKDAISITDMDNNLIFINDSFLEIYGYSREELIEKNISVVNNKITPKILEEIKEATLKDGWHGELINIRKDKTEFPVELWTSIVKDANNNGVGMVGVARDITERKKAEKKNILLAQTVRSVKDAISLTDLNNKIIYVNDAFLKTYGYFEEEIIGKSINILSPEKFSETSKTIHPETIKNPWHGEIINKRKDGTEFPIELWTSVVKDMKGDILATVGVARDVTERKNAEKKLEEVNKKLNRAQQVAKIGSWELFFPSYERNWSDNMYEIMGFPRDIPVSINEIEKRVPTSEFERFNKAIDETVKFDKPYSMDYKIIMPDGSEKYIHDEGEVIRNNNGDVISMFGTTQDITGNKLAEIAVKESEEKYRNIIENAPIGMFRTIPEGKAISVSPGFAKILGYDSVEDVIETVNHQNIGDIIYTDPETRKQMIEMISHSRNWFTVENQFRKKDGKIITGVLSLHSFINPKNQKIEIEGFFTDISFQKQIEENLRKSEKRFKQVAENADEWIWEVNTEGLYTYTSPIIEKILGYNPDEVINKKYFYDFCIPNEKEEIKNTAFEIFNRKEKIKSLINNNVHKNGNTVILETSGVPILDNKNILIGYRGVDKDITKRKQAEENLKKSEEKFRTITEQTTDVVFITDNRGLVTYVSPAAKNIFGFEPKEMIGRHFSEMLSIDDIDKAVELFKFTVDNSVAIKNYEMKMKGKDGSLIYGELNANFFSVGDFIGTAGTMRDITERKKAEEELIKAKEKAEEMNRIKTNFLANMSHEVRTPLVAILGFSEVLSEIVKEDELKNYVDMIHKGGERLLDTLNLILDLSVIEAQKMKIELSPLNIVKEAKDVVKLFEKTAEKKNLQIETICHIDSIIIYLDAKILRQILNNLINNAIKYTNTGGIKVKISEEKKNDKNFVALRVIDTGIGISEDKQNLIWEEFRQASEGFSRSFEGTGLGLSITKKFVEKLGGEIFLEKSDVDVGSIFTVLFLNEKKIKTSDIHDKDEMYPDKIFKSVKKDLPTILYVEDDPIAIDIVKAFLKNYCIVDSASSGSEGIEKAKTKIYDAILMDINLGKDMDGIEATGIIRKISEYINIPIIAITAFAMVGDKDEFFEKGCTHYISKPFTKIELQQLIMEALKLKK